MRTAVCQGTEYPRYLFESFEVERVVHPLAAAATTDQASQPQDLEVKRQQGLLGSQNVRDLANASFTTGQNADYLQPFLVGKCLEDFFQRLNVHSRICTHG
jgi:hypothetical protein